MVLSSVKSLSSIVVFALTASLPSAMAVSIDVQVGPNGRFAYDPPFVNAEVGDVVNFIFNPKNHTVTQSTFDTPCVAIPNAIDSGFNPVAANSTDPPPTFQVDVTDNSPVWFYCQQKGHCGAGMVFAINPGTAGSNNSFDAFQQRANATSQPTTHVILVGSNGTLTYDPPHIQAAIGDSVVFEFRAKNHTVTQSTFPDPCVRFVNSTSGEKGFSSGFQPVADNATTFPTFNITVNDTAPIWGYCGQPGHCGKGMVFAINSDESSLKNFSAFQHEAESINGTTGGSGDGSGAVAWRPATGIFAAVVGAVIAWSF